MFVRFVKLFRNVCFTVCAHSQKRAKEQADVFAPKSNSCVTTLSTARHTSRLMYDLFRKQCEGQAGPEEAVPAVPKGASPEPNAGDVALLREEHAAQSADKSAADFVERQKADLCRAEEERKLKLAGAAVKPKAARPTKVVIDMFAESSDEEEAEDAPDDKYACAVPRIAQADECDDEEGYYSLCLFESVLCCDVAFVQSSRPASSSRQSSRWRSLSVKVSTVRCCCAEWLRKVSLEKRQRMLL